MAKHLPGKVARAISDFLTICEIVNLLEHEMEKRIVARHGLVKLDALLDLLARLKNHIRDPLPQKEKGETQPLSDLITRLRNDLEGSDFETGRDAMAAHALKLDLSRIIDTWSSMGEATFGVFAADLIEIDVELRRLAIKYPTLCIYPGAAAYVVKPQWRPVWRHESFLGDPSRPRIANIYPGLATAGIVSPVPGGHPAQDATIRASGLATFIRQIRILLQGVDRGSEVERLFAEMMTNDYFALWELLFISDVQNEHGNPDPSVVDHWRTAHFKGTAKLAALEGTKSSKFDQWREEIRNKTSAHIDPNVDIWAADLQNWPISIDWIINECLRLIEGLREAAAMELRSDIFFRRPEIIADPRVKGLANQEGRRWSDN